MSVCKLETINTCSNFSFSVKCHKNQTLKKERGVINSVIFNMLVHVYKEYPKLQIFCVDVDGITQSYILNHENFIP